MGEAIVVLYCRMAELTPDQTERVMRRAMALPLGGPMSYQIDRIIEEEKY